MKNAPYSYAWKNLWERKRIANERNKNSRRKFVELAEN